MQPLPLVPPGAVAVGEGVAFFEDDCSGAVFVWGRASFTWSSSDTAGRRLAAVQLGETSAATQRETAAAFSVDETTLWRWRDAYSKNGVVAILDEKKGPKRRSVLTDEKLAEIVELRRKNKTFREIAAEAGVSARSAHRASLGLLAPGGDGVTGTDEEALEPLALPADRSAERVAARLGVLAEAKPVVAEGSHLPFVGALVALPALAATGLLDAAEAVYGAGQRVKGASRSAFYGIRSLLLSIVVRPAARRGEGRGYDSPRPRRDRPPPRPRPGARGAPAPGAHGRTRL
ncbi:MAG: hypothetical protein M0Z69_15275 [Actinomycetota bacterium]|nr:hypothetical protein [Actinomycetota bacterium]